MSKMSNINLALQEQAEELGFSTVQEAIDNGYDVVYSVEKSKLISPQDQAHEAWLKERAGVLADLRYMLDEETPLGDQDKIDALSRAIDFIEKGEV